MAKRTFSSIAKKVLRFIANPRLLLCVGVAWIITNGWSYVFLAVGTYCKIGWMSAVAGAYLSFLWFPMSPEKVVTCLIAMALLRWWFPNDEKTLAVLKTGYANAKAASKARVEAHKVKREQRRKAKANK